MRIGIPTEIKPKEGRVALVPPAAAELVRRGHEVFLQSGAGVLTGYPDEVFTSVGVKIADDAADLYARAQMVVKVKEPIEAEFDLLREDHLLFCFLHLAALPAHQFRRQRDLFRAGSVLRAAVGVAAGRAQLLQG